MYEVRDAAFNKWWDETHVWYFDPACEDLYEKHTKKAFDAGWAACKKADYELVQNTFKGTPQKLPIGEMCLCHQGFINRSETGEVYCTNCGDQWA